MLLVKRSISIMFFNILDKYIIDINQSIFVDLLEILKRTFEDFKKTLKTYFLVSVVITNL